MQTFPFRFRTLFGVGMLAALAAGSRQSIATYNSTTPSLNIGVMIENVQYSDIAGIDIFDNMSAAIYESFGDLLPKELQGRGIDINFHYISSSLEPVPLTANVRIVPTWTYDTAPRDLDILLIGGPPLDSHPEGADSYMKAAAKETKLILTTCTGGYWLASSGVLDGRNATTNRDVLEISKKLYPNVDWQYERWTIDETASPKLWTAGGARAGYDMIATYVSEHFDKDVAAYSFEILDIDLSTVVRYYKN